MSFCLGLAECCQTICDLPDDLLVQILLYIPTKYAVTTSILSKRWRYVWTMLPELTFKDEEWSKSIGSFIDKSFQLHKAPKLSFLDVELSPQCPIDEVNVGKLVEKAVNRTFIRLDLRLLWKAEPMSLPMSLYTCDTLVSLTLSNKILVDVSFEASLPSLLYLYLLNVVYKNQDSLASLLSSSPVLEYMIVERHEDDNLTIFTVKVSSLKMFYYKYVEDEEDDYRTLVLDCPALTKLSLTGIRHYWLINNMPYLDRAYIDALYETFGNFLRYLSSSRSMSLYLSTSKLACCNAVMFPRLIKLCLYLKNPIDWLEPVISLLQNSPKLKTFIITVVDPETGCLFWNPPSTIPECLSSHLELFRWNAYGGREDEKQLVRYILANSKCLRTLEISFIETCNLEECRKELESMWRISASSPLLYFPTEANWNIF